MSDENNLPDEGFVRLSQFLGRGRPLPIGRSTWWAGVKTGKYPKPVKLSEGITAWSVESIRALISEKSK